MRKSIIATVILVGAALVAVTCTWAQQQKFINVEGRDLAAKLEAAKARGASSGGSYWLAYSFSVRPNVGFDVDFSGGDETSQPKVVSGATGEHETRNLGVFMLHQGSGGDAPGRVEVYNVNRQRDHGGTPVYWLGSAETPESLGLLRRLVAQAGNETAAGNLTDAIALHDDPQAASLLRELLSNAPQEGVRTKAAFWLGRIPGHLQQLADVVGNQREASSVRKQAVMAIGKSREAAAGTILQRLYNSGLSRDLKAEILDAAAKNRQGPTLDLLNTVAQNDDDADLRSRAQSHLNKAAGKKEKSKSDKQHKPSKGSMQ